MAARGSFAKQEITKKILETFEGSFLYNGGKELRIPVMENGDVVQIKITMTAAKVNVENGADTAIPSVEKKTQTEVMDGTDPAHLTEEEKQEVNDLLKSLNL